LPSPTRGAASILEAQHCKGRVKVTAPSNNQSPSFIETLPMLAFRLSKAPRVLIVDDDPLMLERVAALVQEAGYETRMATSGAAALAKLRKEFCPILIIDWSMPDMDGMTLCQTLRTEWYPGYLYVLVLTARADPEDILAGLNAGADDYLSKGVSGAEIVARLRTARRIVELEQSLREMLQEKQRDSVTDPLTGAHNRAYLTKHLARDCKNAERSGHPLSMLMLDLDHFKRVNDSYGHGVGDEVLKEFVRRIRAALPRAGDWFARLGGEEFAVVLPHTDLAGATIAGERLRNAVAVSPIPTTVGPVSITCSVGVACAECLPPEKRGDMDALMELADQYLYQSKRTGRNKVLGPQALA
jgi:two-component system cell cycle response regulator